MLNERFVSTSNKINKAAHKNTTHGHTHHSKIKRVDKSCLFESLYSGKVAETKNVRHWLISSRYINDQLFQQSDYQGSTKRMQCPPNISQAKLICVCLLLHGLSFFLLSISFSCKSFFPKEIKGIQGQDIQKNKTVIKHLILPNCHWIH